MDRIDHEGFYIESDFFDTDDCYVNAVILEPNREKIHAASNAVMATANMMCYAMNISQGHSGNSHDDGAWVVYGENWWSRDGLEVEDDDDIYLVHIVQRTIRRE